MNEFTKDELERLLHILKCSSLPAAPLKIKLQSMIDNYCEHEENIHTLGGGMYHSGICKKCLNKI